jgi:hypothetical protein
MEDILRTLQTAGQVLTFPQADILGIPGFRVETLSALDSNYEVERQYFVFQVATFDCAENLIKDGDTFSIEDGVYSYTFKVSRAPRPDFTGFSQLTADLITKALL